MLAAEQSRVKSPLLGQNAQVANPNVAPTTRPSARPAVSVMNRVTAFLCIGAVTAVLWFVAGVGARIQSINDNIYNTQLKIQTMTADNAALASQVDRLTNPTRIINLALNQYHMTYSKPIVIQAGTP